ncbi:hypothetical protein C8J55DRAFT_494330 [Lentinula edodes]|uniref:Uncharacterized protein n=1 Tax=Lentinula lateritia TaxID=40482 RepID=A0A9W8ZPF1_9AGAR|nr:hypothetical protein C8J55DRAFT_494330 [Lentinula edodes]
MQGSKYNVRYLSYPHPIALVRICWPTPTDFLFLTVLAGGSAGTAPAPITAGPPRPPKVEVDLAVIIICQGTRSEHVYLAIGDAAIHAGVLKTQRMRADTILIPQKASTLRVQMNMERSPNTTSIGKASFASRKDREKVINEMLDLEMPPFSQKGTCLDYIRIVLQNFKDRGIIVGSVLESYEKIYEERYQAGRKWFRIAPEERRRR